MTAKVLDFPVELLPLVPFDMGGWTAHLVPQHPFVRDTEAGQACQREWDRINRAQGHVTFSDHERGGKT